MYIIVFYLGYKVPGVGVHLTLLRSLSLLVYPLILSIASARRAAAVPMVVLSNSRFAAGVRLPGALRGVQDGGAIALLPCDFPRRPILRFSPNKSALMRRLLEALLDNFLDICSRDDGSDRRKGVVGGGNGASD